MLSLLTLLATDVWSYLGRLRTLQPDDLTSGEHPFRFRRDTNLETSNRRWRRSALSQAGAIRALVSARYAVPFRRRADASSRRMRLSPRCSATRTPTPYRRSIWPQDVYLDPEERERFERPPTPRFPSGWRRDGSAATAARSRCVSPSARVFDDRRRVEAHDGIVEDVTERRRHDELLRRSERMAASARRSPASRTS